MVTRTAQPLSKALALACLVMAMAWPALVIYYLTTSSVPLLAEKLAITAAMRQGATTLRMAPWQHLVVIVVGTLPAAINAYGLLRARRCFMSFTRGEYFTLAVVRDLRGFAAGIFFSGIAALLAAPLASMVLTMGAEHGEHSLAISVGSGELTSLLFGGIVWQIATVMAKARALADENAQFV